MRTILFLSLVAAAGVLPVPGFSQEGAPARQSDVDELKARLDEVLRRQSALDRENLELRREVHRLRAGQDLLRGENEQLRDQVSGDNVSELESAINALVSRRFDGTVVNSKANPITLSGEFRYRTILAFADTVGGDELDGYWTDSRVRLGFRYEFTDDVTAFAELQSHWAFGDGASTAGLRASPFSSPYGYYHGEAYTDIDLYQAWVEVCDLFNRSELSWKTGRQEIVLGNQFQFGNADWYAGWTFDGTRLDWNSDSFSITALMFKAGSVDGDLQQVHSIPSAHDDDEVYSVYSSIRIAENHTIDLYWIYMNGHGGSGGPGTTVGSLGNSAGGAGLAMGTTAYFHTIGARASGVFKDVLGGLDYNVEGAYQFGDVHGLALLDDVDGWTTEAEIGLTVSSKHAFRLYTRFLYAEGPSAEDSGYVPLYPNRHTLGAGFLARYGILDVLPMANVISGQFGFTVSPAAQWVIGATGIWSTADNNDLAAAVDGHDFGWEADVWALYQATEQLAIVAAVMVLLPDDEGGALWGVDETAVALGLEARLLF